MNEKITHASFFYCYNPKLSAHLAKAGFDYIIKSVSIKTNNVFTMYLKSDELTRAINDYKQS